MFNSLEVQRSSSTLWISAALHATLLAVLLVLPLMFTDRLTLHQNVTMLAEPIELTEAEPLRLDAAAAVLPPLPSPASIPAPAPPLTIPKDILENRIPEIPKPVAPTLPPEPLFIEKLVESPVEAAPPPPPPPPPPARTVVTGVLGGGAGASAAPRSTRDVRTGGFGDPNGTATAGRGDKAPNIASLGSFGGPAAAAPAGRGSKDVVANAGFGGPPAGNAGAAARGRGGATAEGGFGDARPPASAPAARSQAAAAPKEIPAEITFKPKPAYTDEARVAKVEGEVLLRVQFSADGAIRVLEVQKGLPYGLNDAAVRAAQQIQFKPASRDGMPVDSTAVVHIVFQLAL